MDALFTFLRTKFFTPVLVLGVILGFLIACDEPSPKQDTQDIKKAAPSFVDSLSIDQKIVGYHFVYFTLVADGQFAFNGSVTTLLMKKGSTAPTTAEMTANRNKQVRTVAVVKDNEKIISRYLTGLSGDRVGDLDVLEGGATYTVYALPEGATTPTALGEVTTQTATEVQHSEITAGVSGADDAEKFIDVNVQKLFGENSLRIEVGEGERLMFPLNYPISDRNRVLSLATYFENNSSNFRIISLENPINKISITTSTNNAALPNSVFYNRTNENTAELPLVEHYVIISTEKITNAGIPLFYRPNIDDGDETISTTLYKVP